MDSSQTYALYNVISLIVGIISILMVITFFKMSSSLKKIELSLDVLKLLELNKPESKKLIKCEKCGKDYSLSILKKGIFECNGCHQTISL